MKKNYFKIALMIGATLTAAQSNAQLVDCNVFMKGAYVEVGINWNGAFGTSTPAPAGYTTNAVAGSDALYDPCDSTTSTSLARLGFCADPDMDGWSVGTPPFFGDFFMPGVPQEGWSIMADGTQANNWNCNAGIAPGYTTIDSAYVLDSIVALTSYDSATHVLDTIDIQGSYSRVPYYFAPGNNVSYATSGSEVSGVWQGSYDSIAVKQETTLDTNGLSFSVTITLTNLASTPRNNVYYMRTVDPDNDAAQSYNLATFNKIESQLPNLDNLTEVSARGTLYPAAYLAMGSTDTRAKAFFRRSHFGPWALYPNCGTLDMIYPAVDTFDYSFGTGDTLTADVCIGLVFNIGHLASVDTLGAIDSAGRIAATSLPPNRAEISYYYSFQNSGALSVKGIINNAAIKVYPNPAANTMSITGLNATDRLQVLDVMGREATGNWQIMQTGTNTFNLNGLASGVYIILVTDQNGTVKSRQQLQKL